MSAAPVDGPAPVPAELILFIGGGVITVLVTVFVIVLLIRANRDHTRQLELEAQERRASLAAQRGEAPLGASDRSSSGTNASGGAS
ncbi:MAG: hypothetical protein KF724_07145 [Phycisphaeraceae bacterium]|nr:hypothetical protein [Phycisphaeraceae bacterium]